MSASLSVEIGSLRLANPILVASGTFGYAREMAGMVDINRLGGIVPKTITQAPRAGNAPWRTVETTAGLLNSIGLDNDGIDAFIEHHLPYLGSLAAPAIVSIAGRTTEEFTQMAARLSQYDEVGAIELNISCPNVSGGVDFGICPETCRDLIASVRAQCTKPLLAKVTPNVARIADVAAAAEDGGADGISAINTLLGMAVDWRRKKPLLGNVMGGLSGPAIKPVALRCVYQIAQRVKIPVIGIGGIGSIDDVMEFLVAGATAVQIGTANFNDPTVSTRILDQLPAALAEIGAASVQEVIGTLQTKSQPAPNLLGSPVA